MGSLRCDCGDQLHMAMKMIDEAGKGAILYMRQEGRGIGLGNKIRAYALQDKGNMDTAKPTRTSVSKPTFGITASARLYEGPRIINSG